MNFEHDHSPEKRITDDIFGQAAQLHAAADFIAIESEIWLRHNFDCLEIVNTGRFVIAALRDIFTFSAMDISPSDLFEMQIREQTGAIATIRRRYKVVPLETRSDSVAESVGQLFRLASEQSFVFRSIPKAGQSLKIVPGKEYLSIKSNDRLHNHESNDIFDFGIGGLETSVKPVVFGGLSDFTHSHLLDPVLL